jgi:hypothetical protein
MDMSSFNYNVSVAMAVLGSLAAVFAAVQTWAWMRRAGKIAVDFVVIIKFVIFGIGNTANAFFVVIFGACVYMLIFYKVRIWFSTLVVTH